MSRSYTISQARAELPRIIDAAQQGASIEVTRRGKPVAVIISQREHERLKAARPNFAELHKKFFEEHGLDEEGLGIEPGYWEALRDRSPGREVEL